MKYFFLKSFKRVINKIWEISCRIYSINITDLLFFYSFLNKDKIRLKLDIVIWNSISFAIH